jgi:hypothetical protein
MDLDQGAPFGSFSQWARWVRDPLLALGCRDPVHRVAESKQRDVRRQELSSIFELWLRHHGHRPVTGHDLHDEVKARLDPQVRGRQFLAHKLETLAGARPESGPCRPVSGQHHSRCRMVTAGLEPAAGAQKALLVVRGDMIRCD